MKPIVNISNFPLVTNVCNQRLREILKASNFSLAHVEMLPGEQSLLHCHHKMTEIYFILSGDGELIHGGFRTNVSQGACIPILRLDQHKLTNKSGMMPLTHLVFAIPPFDPTDLEMLAEEEATEKVQTFKLPDTFVGFDGGKIYEFKSVLWQDLYMSIAYGYLEPYQKAKLHFHKNTREWYYIVEGRGTIQLGSDTFDIKDGDLVTVEIGMSHSLKNTESIPLKILAICEPEFTLKDSFVI